MRKLMMFPLLLALLCSCAGMTPQQTATNTLLGIHDTMVNVETGIKEPCATGVIPAVDCQTISDYLLQAKPAYNLAVDAQIVWLTSGAGEADFTAKKQALNSLVGNALALAVKYGVKGGSK